MITTRNLLNKMHRIQLTLLSQLNQMFQNCNTIPMNRITRRQMLNNQLIRLHEKGNIPQNSLTLLQHKLFTITQLPRNLITP